MIKSGRSARSRKIGTSNGGVRRCVSAAVDEIRISTSRHCSSQVANGTAIPSNSFASSSARAGVRLLTRRSETPREASARKVLALVSPAPNTKTFRPRKSPKNFHPITSREQQHFAAAEMTQQYGRSGVTSKAFTCFDRRGAMVETKAEKVHAR